MSNLIVLIIAAIVGASVFYFTACSRQTTDPVVGGIYSVPTGNGDFGVIKILVVEPGIIHVRYYSNRFNERPVTVDSSELSMGTLLDENFGVGHLPMSRVEFTKLKPIFISVYPVGPEELEGYNYWKENQGGVFSDEN